MEKTKIYYSPSNNRFYFSNIYHSRPNDSVEVTEQYNGYRNLQKQGHLYKAGDDGFPIHYHPDELLTKKEKTNKVQQKQISQYKWLLKHTDRFEYPAYKVLFSNDEYNEFTQWRTQLILSIQNENGDVIPTPPFIIELIEKFN